MTIDVDSTICEVSGKAKADADWRYHAFIASRDDLPTAAAYHRAHATVELAIRDLKQNAGLEHLPNASRPSWDSRLAAAWRLDRHGPIHPERA